MKNKTNNNGFTLIEVMTAITILSVGLLMLLPMMVVSIQANDLAQDFTDSSMLIKQKMEELKGMSNPVSGVDSVGTAQRIWTVVNAENNLKQLLVDITWVDKDGHVRSNRMMSYMMPN